MKTLFLICSLLLFLGCKKYDSSLNITPVPIKLPPIAQYQFTGNYNDASGNYNIGIGYRTILTTDRLGTDTSACLLDTGYVEILNKNILDITTNTLSLCAWFNPSSLPDSAYLISKSETIDTSGTIIKDGGPYSISIINGKVCGVIYGIDSIPVILKGTTQVLPNVWQHIALTWDGTNALLYYNGQVENTMPFHKKILATNGNVYLGTDKWQYPKGSFLGTIDNVRIYNRYVTRPEIANFYSAYK